MGKIKLELKFGTQYLGPEFGSMPFLDLYYMVPGQGKEESLVFVASNRDKLETDSDFIKVIELSKTLQKYDNGIIKVDHAYYGDYDYITRIRLDGFSQINNSYQDGIRKFSKMVADIYYDYNGRKIGFVADTPEPIEIRIGLETLNVENKLDGNFAREALANDIFKKIMYWVMRLNAEKVNGIEEHMSPRK